MIKYRFNEEELLKQIKAYVDETYSGHYASNQYQATDVIVDAGLGHGFCVGNIIKYAKRYGRKDGYNRKDLMKLLHYGLIMLFIHDKENEERNK